MPKRKVSPDEGRGNNKEQKKLPIKKTKKCEADEAILKCEAGEAILKSEKLNDGKLVRITLAKGWEYVLKKVGEDDPACYIDWDFENLDRTVVNCNQAIVNNLPGAPPPPVWLNLAGGAALTVPGLQASIMAHVQTQAGGGGVIGKSLIAPNTIPQYGCCGIHFSHIGFDPFFRAYAVCPIGRHYCLADKKAQTTGVAAPIPAPPVGQGVPVFA
jgi:hypothetical protein